MKRICLMITLLFALIRNGNAQIKLTNPYQFDPNGYWLHNTKFGGAGSIAQIAEVTARDFIISKGYMETNRIRIDRNNSGDGLSSTTTAPQLVFGDNNSGESITSKRTNGNTRWGLEFYTNHQNRIHIDNDGSMAIGVGSGNQPSQTFNSRVQINNNYNEKEASFYKPINLLNYLQASGLDSKVDNLNLVSNNPIGSMNNATSILTFWNRYNSSNINPTHVVANHNTLVDYTAPKPSNNNLLSYTVGTFNDLDDRKVAFYNLTLPPPNPSGTYYNARIGVLSVTNTQNDNDLGRGKMAGWFVNRGALTNSGGLAADGAAVWADGIVVANSLILSTSDKKLKNNITPINGAIMSNLLKLKPCTYFKNDENIKRLNYGFIAQELKEVFPDIVVDVTNPATKENFLTVDYQALHAIAITAIQIQQNKIDELTEQIKKINEKLK